MAFCSWCRKEYSTPVIFHICADGTTFYDRSCKSPEEFDIEHARQNRLAAGLKVTRDAKISTQTEWIVETYDGKVYSEKITDYDYKMLRGMKISLKDKP